MRHRVALQLARGVDEIDPDLVGRVATLLQEGDVELAGGRGTVDRAPQQMPSSALALRVDGGALGNDLRQPAGDDAHPGLRPTRSARQD